MPGAPGGMPALDTPYGLTDEQVRAYQRDGHILLRALCTPEEAAAAREAITAAAYRSSSEQRPLEERDTYGRAFLQVMNLWLDDEAVRRYVLAKRFAGAAARLMGVSRVRLYHDQALIKEAGGGLTPWHQDQYYWPLGTDRTLTMWMPLVDAGEDMGTMTFASGSHHAGFLGHLEISDRSEAAFREEIERRGYALAPAGPMAAGDATFHTGWTLHGAPGNTTDRAREVMTIIYYEDGARLLEPDNRNRANDLATWFPGQSPGELAASPLNPIVYP